MVRRGLAVMVGAMLLLSVAATARASNPNGSGGDIPAFYDGQLFTINFMLLNPDLHKNPSFNIIYQCDACEASGLDFVSVLDAIPGDGFNPIWEEVQITFNEGFQPVQFTSDDQVLEAAANGEIT